MINQDSLPPSHHITRSVTLCFPSAAPELYEPYRQILDKHGIDYTRLKEEHSFTVAEVEDGGASLAADLAMAAAPAVYLIYHAGRLFGPNGGYEAQMDGCRAVVEVDNMNRIIVHPAVLPKGFSMADWARIRRKNKCQMINVRMFLSMVYSKKFQSYFAHEIPLPIFI